jgi:hypothetical protein
LIQSCIPHPVDVVGVGPGGQKQTAGFGVGVESGYRQRRIIVHSGQGVGIGSGGQEQAEVLGPELLGGWSRLARILHKRMAVLAVF